MTIIVLDPGHGGSDPGAVGSGLQEKELTLDIAAKTRDALASYDADVYMTRDSDIDFEPDERADLANRLGAAYFLSIHINAGGGTGFESYVHTNAVDRSLALRDIVHNRLSSFYSSAGFPDRGGKSANFAVLRLTEMPAALLENLFIDTPGDAARLADPAFRVQIAGAISAGLVQALGLKPVSGGEQAEEINKLKSDGLIASGHGPAEDITWGTFAAVINRYRGKSSLSGQWDPAGEVAKLKVDGLIFSDRDEGGEVPWGEFASVLNRLRGRGSTSPWDPAAEIQKLWADSLVSTVHDPAEKVNWGHFAAVLNAIRGR
ncbi:N-acetylmuramoyl-L-alanine amidase [Pelotomaculum propionicicum]|uniref:N-acetylmuramoyl-L-alanine amidase n=1 Tax=Pelotomaculum propionicicum TaxID=258475 RepID=UPI003B79AF16